MVARAGGYFGTPFKGQCRVTQGDPTPPTIFILAADAFIQHWVLVVKEVEEETGL